jgi:hypothetical protein
MTDERSRNAVDVAIRYGNGDATDEELKAAAYAAYAADAADADAYAYAADAAYARQESLKKSADICRLYLPIPKI